MVIDWELHACNINILHRDLVEGIPYTLQQFCFHARKNYDSVLLESKVVEACMASTDIEMLRQLVFLAFLYSAQKLLIWNEFI